MFATVVPERAAPGAAVLRYGRGASAMLKDTNADAAYWLVIGVSRAGPVSKFTVTSVGAAAAAGPASTSTPVTITAPRPSVNTRPWSVAATTPAPSAHTRADEVGVLGRGERDRRADREQHGRAEHAAELARRAGDGARGAEVLRRGRRAARRRRSAGNARPSPAPLRSIAGSQVVRNAGSIPAPRTIAMPATYSRQPGTITARWP